jgi:hypothetical protein
MNNPHCFSHPDTVILYRIAFEGLHAEEEYSDCFPGYQQEMSLDEAWRVFYHGGEVYEKCRTNLIAHLKEDAEKLFPELATANVSYEEMAEHLLDYWTEILNETVDTECE